MKNKIIIKEFEKLIEQIKFDINAGPKKKKRENMYRLSSVNKVLDIIKKYDHKIKNGEELLKYKNFGKKSAERINEILKTGKLKEITINDADENINDIIKELSKIINIGKISAYDFVKNNNIKSIKDLQTKINNNEIDVPESVKIGIKYYGKYKMNIPRKEIKLISNFLTETSKIFDDKLHIKVCGSYRREKDMSDDIDLLIVHENMINKNDIDKNYLQNYVNHLKKNNFIIDDITFESYTTKYMGFCKFKNNKIRIDIRLVPFNSFPSALLYFTGSGDYNLGMRRFAKILGYTLNEYGLYYGKNKTSIKVTSEKDIFNTLGLEYIEPKYREKW